MRVSSVVRLDGVALECTITHFGRELEFALRRGKVAVVGRCGQGCFEIPGGIYALMTRRATAILLEKPKLGLR